MDWSLEVYSCQSLKMSLLTLFKIDSTNSIFGVAKEIMFDSMEELRLSYALLGGHENGLAGPNSICHIIQSRKGIVNPNLRNFMEYLIEVMPRRYNRFRTIPLGRLEETS
jgi:hypothetical protein